MSIIFLRKVSVLKQTSSKLIEGINYFVAKLTLKCGKSKTQFGSF